MVGDIMQPTHLLFVLVVALLVLGPKRLPEVGRQLGNGLRDFRAAINGERSEERDEPARPHVEPVAAADYTTPQPAEPAPVFAEPSVDERSADEVAAPVDRSVEMATPADAPVDPGATDAPASALDHDAGSPDTAAASTSTPNQTAGAVPLPETGEDHEFAIKDPDAGSGPVGQLH